MMLIHRVGLKTYKTSTGLSVSTYVVSFSPFTFWARGSRKKWIPFRFFRNHFFSDLRFFTHSLLTGTFFFSHIKHKKVRLYIYIYIYRRHSLDTVTLDQILNEAVSTSHGTQTHANVMNTTILLQSISKLLSRLVSFTFVWHTVSKEKFKIRSFK